MNLSEVKNIARQLATYTEHRSRCEIRVRPRANGATWKCTCGLCELIKKLEEEDENSTDDGLAVGG